MLKITHSNINHLLLGSLFYGTGGGLPYKKHKEIFERIFKFKKELILKDLEEFKENDYLVTVYGVGDPSKTNIDFKNLIRQSLELYSQKTNIKPKGIIPGEIGAEGLAFEASAYLNLPVVNSDLVGGRAAPEIQLDCFTIFKKPLTPLLGSAINNKHLFLFGEFSALEIEKILRDFFSSNGGVGILIGYPILVKDFKKICIKGTVERAIEVGKILSGGSFEKLKEFVKPRKVINAKILKVNLKDEEGFFKGKVIFSEGYKIFVKNENIALIKDQKLISKFPEPIIVLNIKLQPIHNTEIKKYFKKEVIILVLLAEGYWKTNKAKKLTRHLI